MYRFVGVILLKEIGFATTVNIQMGDVPSSENCSKSYDGDALQDIASSMNLFSGHITYGEELLAVVTMGKVQRIDDILEE